MKNFKQFFTVMLMFAVVVVCIIVMVYYRYGNLYAQVFPLKNKGNRICFKDHCYMLELAITDVEKSRGLQNRDHLEKNRGMLFLMDNRVPQKFWMKDTLIALDMIWLDDFGKILYIEHAAYPCEKDPCATYGPNFPAAYVLELNAGEAARLDMRLGERIVLELRDVK